MTIEPGDPSRPDWPSRAGTGVRVSVIMPAFNAAPFIEEAVESVLTQGVDGLELLVVDDGSTDDTLVRLRRVQDPRLRVVPLSKVGVGAARNHGLSLARGEYLGFLDADDRWRPGKLRQQLALLESEPDVGFVFTNFRRFDASGFHAETQFDFVPHLRHVPTRPSRAGEGRVILGSAFEALVGCPQLPCWTQTMLARAALVRGIAFPPDMRLSQDLYYVLNVYRVAAGAYIAEPLVEVRRHGGNSYRHAFEKIRPDIEALTRTLATVTNSRERTALRRRLGRAWLAAGYHQLHAGHVATAA